MIQSLHGVFKRLEIVLENAKIAHVTVRFIVEISQYLGHYRSRFSWNCAVVSDSNQYRIQLTESLIDDEK